VAITYVGGTLVYAIAALTGWRGDRGTPAMTIATTVIQDIGFVGAVAAVASLTAGRLTARQIGVRPVALGRALAAMALAFVAFQAFGVAYASLVDTSQPQEVLRELGADRATGYLVLAILIVCVLAPIAEEILFRGFFFGALRNVMPTSAAVVVTGLMFGLVHVLGTPFALIVPLAVFGAALCVVYLRTGSLLPCMALHAFNNALAFGAKQHLGAAGTVALMIGASCLVVLLGLLAARSRALNPLPAPA
jgi:membrane protease YdiL (CAAX protease family)